MIGIPRAPAYCVNFREGLCPFATVVPSATVIPQPACQDCEYFRGDIVGFTEPEDEPTGPITERTIKFNTCKNRETNVCLLIVYGVKHPWLVEDLTLCTNCGFYKKDDEPTGPIIPGDEK